MILHKIDYNGGKIWVDKSEDYPVMKEGQLFFRPIHNTIDTCIHNEQVFEKEYPIVAQSITNPSYIDGVPFVKVGEDDTQIALKAYKVFPINPFYDGDELIDSDTNLDNRKCWIKGYKAAQAKQFTEADLMKAYRLGTNKGAYFSSLQSDEDTDAIEHFNKTEESELDEFINSLKPKVDSIEIEMTTSVPFAVGVPSSEYPKAAVKHIPVTYQKDGKTFLTVTKINYE